MPITELRIQGLRTIEDVRLKLDGLTVLIGDNGAGKSSIIEACELLRRAMSDRFMEEFYSIHGGLPALLRHGAPHLKFGVTVTPEESTGRGFDEIESVEYDFALAPQGAFAGIIGEELWLRSNAKSEPTRRLGKRTKTKLELEQERKRGAALLMRRTASECEFWEEPRADSNGSNFEIHNSALVLATEPGFKVSSTTIGRAHQIVQSHLSSISVHLPFEVLPSWAARSLDRKSALRTSSLFAPADSLSRLGANLANAYHALKNTLGQAHWQETLGYVRLGLGERVEDVTTWADPGGGNIGLSLKFKDLDQQVPTAQLSDGMLSFLAFVALFRLHRTPPSLLGFDEPDLHLHPQLLMRVLDFFEEMARRHPVLLATHSDRLLDGLSDPARSVVLCELDERSVTHLVRPDREALARWLERYRGIGDLRAAGYERSVMTRPDDGA